MGWFREPLPAGAAACVLATGHRPGLTQYPVLTQRQLNGFFFFSAEETGVSRMFLEPSLQVQEVLLFVPLQQRGIDSERSEKPVLDLSPSFEPISQLASLTPLHVPSSSP